MFKEISEHILVYESISRLRHRIGGNIGLLGTRAMFRSARKFGESGTGLCV